MQQINRPKPDIKIYSTGQIDILTKAARRLQINKESGISFLIDDSGNLYLRKASPGEGLRPTSIHGANFFRFYSAETARQILSLTDIPKGIKRAGFRLGEPEDEISYPVITRRIL